jgi:hypothetical protein
MVSSKRVLQKIEKKESYRKKKVYLQTQFRSFLVRNSPKEAANLERKDAKFP